MGRGNATAMCMTTDDDVLNLEHGDCILYGASDGVAGGVNLIGESGLDKKLTKRCTDNLRRNETRIAAAEPKGLRRLPHGQLGKIISVSGKLGTHPMLIASEKFIS